MLLVVVSAHFSVHDLNPLSFANELSLCGEHVVGVFALAVRFFHCLCSTKKTASRASTTPHPMS